MERGEDWEYAAVRNRWAAIERQRQVTRRLLAAFCLGLVAVVLFMFAVTPAACTYGRGVSNACSSVTTGPVFDALVVASVAALGVGLWLCRSALAVRTRNGYNGW